MADGNVVENTPKKDISSKNSFLFASMAIYFVGLFISKFAIFIILPFITRTIPAADYGSFDFSQNIIYVIQPLFSLQISEAIFRFLIKAKDEEEKKRILSSSSGVIFAGIAFAAFSFFIVDSFIYKLDNCWLMFANFATFIILTALQMVARSMKHNKDFAISGVINTLVMLVVQLLALLVFKWGVPGLFAGYIIGELTACLFLFIRLKLYKQFSFKCFSFATLKPMLKFSLPLIPNNISWWAATLICKAMLGGIVSPESQGLYAVTAKFTAILVLFTEVFRLSWLESAVINYDNDDNDKEYNSLVLDKYSILLFTGCSLAIPIISLIFPFFIDGSYQAAVEFIPIAMFAACFAPITSFYGAGYNASKKTVGSLITSLLGTGTTVLLCFLLLKFANFGIYSIPVSSIAGYLVVWITRQISMKKFFPIKLNYLHLGLLAFEAVAVSLAQHYFGTIGSIISLVLTLFIFVVFNWGLVIELLNRFVPSTRGKSLKELLKMFINYLGSAKNAFKYLFLFYLPTSLLLYFIAVYVERLRQGLVSEVILLILILFCLPFLFKKKPRIIDILVLSYAGYSVLTLIFSLVRGLSFTTGMQEVGVVVLPVFLYFIAKQFGKNKTAFYKTLLLFINLTVFIGVLFLIFSPLYYFQFVTRLLNGFTEIYGQVKNVRLQSVISCTIVGLICPIGAAISIELLMNKIKVSYFLSFLISAGGAFLSGQRASMVGLILVIVYMSIRLLLMFTRKKRIIIPLLIGAVGAVALLSIFVPTLRNIFMKFGHAFSERIGDYVKPFQLGANVIWGYGLGTMGHHAIYSSGLIPEGITDCAFTKVLAETGFIGFGVFLSIFGFEIYRVIKCKSFRKNIIPIMSILLIWFNSLGSNGFNYLHPGVIMWSMLGFMEHNNEQVSEEIILKEEMPNEAKA